MGCVESTASDEPAMDANGMFPPPESWRKWAKLSLGAGMAIQTTQLFNQMAIFDKLASWRANRSTRSRTRLRKSGGSTPNLL